jgi:hypothetical protein
LDGAAYTMPPNAQDVKMMRALVKLTLSRSLVDKLHTDIAEAIQTLEERGPVSESEPSRSRRASPTEPAWPARAASLKGERPDSNRRPLDHNQEAQSHAGGATRSTTFGASASLAVHPGVHRTGDFRQN